MWHWNFSDQREYQIEIHGVSLTPIPGFKKYFQIFASFAFLLLLALQEECSQIMEIYGKFATFCWIPKIKTFPPRRELCWSAKFWLREFSLQIINFIFFFLCLVSTLEEDSQHQMQQPQPDVRISWVHASRRLLESPET